LICIGGANIVFPLASHGVGAWGTASGATMPISGGALRIAWLVNSPQLVLSLCYLALNNICTFLASAEEWNDFARTRKGLRVSRPTAEQRSTYFCSSPTNGQFHLWLQAARYTGSCHSLSSWSGWTTSKETVTVPVRKNLSQRVGIPV
jgi:hypothetical protein